MLSGDQNVGGWTVSETTVDLPPAVWPVTTRRTGLKGDCDCDSEPEPDMASKLAKLACAEVVPLYSSRVQMRSMEDAKGQSGVHLGRLVSHKRIVSANRFRNESE